ncbi:MAG: VOC family protein [Anaerolineales bacterium]|nr:VOC family protein [Anaerolineales bacterium]
MTAGIALVTFVVREYAEALAFFVETLGFERLEDRPLGGGKRWVRVAPAGSRGAALLLARAVTPDQLAHVGNQTGGRVFLFFQTADFWGDYHALRARGVRFIEAPRLEAYGWVVVFEDLYGNRWDLLEAPAAA